MSLESAAVSTMESVPARKPRRPVGILLGLITLPVLILDQATKLYVSAHMELYESIAVIPHWFDITYTRNPGAAFSFFAGLPGWFRVAFLVSLSVVAITVLVVLLARAREITLNAAAFALILAGALGNLIDRGVRGQVIDFIRLHYYGWNYPVFNVADCAITIGVTLIILASILNPDADS